VRISLLPFQPWVVWPLQRDTSYREDRDTPAHFWTRYHWLFVVVEIRGAVVPWAKV
jgi:hypothetical protein